MVLIAIVLFQNILEFCATSEQFKLILLNKRLHAILKIKKITSYPRIDKIGDNILLPTYSRLKELEFCYSVDRTPINHLVHLERLKISRENLSVDDISRLTKLKDLEITLVKNVNLNHLVNLKKLVLRSCSLKTESISELTQLEFLDIHNYGQLDISIFTNLKTLKIDFNYHKYTSQMLIPFKKLTCLNIDYCEDIDNINFLTNLECLSINKCNKITDISELQNLIELELQFNSSIDKNGISRLMQLKILKLNEIENVDISMLTNLTTLRLIHIKNVCINDILMLTNLLNLEIIECPNFTSINSLTQVTSLTVSENTLGMSEINKLINVKELYLYGTVYDDVSGASYWKYKYQGNTCDVVNKVKKEPYLCGKYIDDIDALNLPKLNYLEYGYWDVSGYEY
ncbi:MAG: hypothetical protein Edafosvirus17_21 [Edafosvirus sp.]|uniref:Leucine-rich repeat protein n=1 Tax=Edafosvirus sp. TaxID=2487765 RepID=A0A3G4ZUH2_9VIRU|nr:MAG: hypothetical protein Edafosvirus17_21 [Edafosvirus sp.]